MTIASIFEKRRSIYNLGNSPIMKPAAITKLIKHALKHAPTAFNSQSARIVVLYGKSYQKLWDITLDALSKVVSWDKMPDTIVKLDGFRRGLGTILFFEDQKTIEDLQNKYPLYAEGFAKWAQQSSGMLQYMIWAALAEQGIGASLQHYNPLIDDAVRQEFAIPQEWQMVGQMPFGSINGPAEAKSFLPIEERIKVFD